MNESRGRMTPYSMKAERMQRRVLPPPSVRRGHNQAIRMSYWRRISRIGTLGAR